MKKVIGLIFATGFLSLSAVAQSSLKTTIESAPQLEQAEAPVSTPVAAKVTQASQTTVLWSEDFANGIPSTWINQGYDVNPSTGVLTANALCNWEYRGPNTTPSNAVGSRGAYAGPNQTGNQGAPINSATASNGFIIFDSDYLDTDGDRSTPGGGNAPSPHIGTLTTDTMDLTGQPNVEVTFSGYARVFFARFQVAVSIDGGLNFPDTVAFHTNLTINGSSNNATNLYADISSTAGNQANVVLRFIFDGSKGNTSSSGYYFWQIDDIQVQALPKHRLDFAVQNGGVFIDMATNNDFENPDYGHVLLSEAEPVKFDAVLVNTGSAVQNNVRFKVDVLNGSGNVVQTASSSPVATLNSGDTASFTQLLTGNINFTSTDDYSLVFYATSDSIGKADNIFANNPDTLNIAVNDTLMGLDFGRIDNYVGTNSIASGKIIAMGFRLNLNNTRKIKGVYMGLSSQTDSTATLIAEIYDTTGFSYGGAGGPAGNPIAVANKQLTAADVTALGTTISFSAPVNLNAGGYLVIVNFIPSFNGVVNIPNDQSLRSGVNSVVVQTNMGNWFSRFSNSNTIASLHIRAIFESTFSVSFATTDVMCPTDSTGSATATIAGSGTYSYLWSNGDTGPTADSLAAGTHTLTVTSGGTSFNYSVSISSMADSILVSATVQDEVCANGNNGSITLTNDGTSPLSYLWSTNDTTASITNLAAGTYSVSLTDTSGCSLVKTYTVAPGTGSIQQPTLTTCGTLNLCKGDTVNIGLQANYSSYLWPDSSFFANINITQSGQYFAKVDNGGNCFAYSDTLTVNVVEPYEGLEICMVTFDPATGQNKAIFTNPNLAGIDSINLFKREPVPSANYSLTGTTSGTGAVFDTNITVIDAFPPYQYSLGITDTCGNRSVLSAPHTSMALGVITNGNGNADLGWTPYLGLNVAKYRIYKSGSQGSSFALIDSVGATVTTYVDVNSTDSGYAYLVEAVFAPAPACTNGNFKGSVITADYNPLGMEELSISSFKVFPNPTSDFLSVVNPTQKELPYQLQDLSGKTVATGLLSSGENVVDLSGLANGMYLLKIEGVREARKVNKKGK